MFKDSDFLKAVTGLKNKIILCPKCGNENNPGVSTTKDRINSYTPSDGDIAICLFCASVIKFTNNATELVLVYDEELLELNVKHPGVLRNIDSARLAVQRMLGID